MEMTVLHAIQNIRCPLLDKLMIFLSLIGDKGLIWIIIGLVFLIFKKYRKCGVAVLISLLLCLIFGNGLFKNIVCRARPCWIDDSIKLIISVPRDYSFPSGHTFSSFASACCIAYFHRKHGIFAFVLAILIAFSRLYLFVHYPTDILGGIILGVFAAAGGIAFVKWLSKKDLGFLNNF